MTHSSPPPDTQLEDTPRPSGEDAPPSAIETSFPSEAPSPVQAQEVPAALRTAGLTRRFGAFTAVDGIDLVVPRGAFFGFLGPNGAGKSTTIKMLTGLLAPTAGRIEVLGRDLATDDLEIKRRIGVVPEDLSLFDRLTGAEMLHFAGRMHSLARAEVTRRSAELLELMELDRYPRTLIVEYSHGMKKKLSLAAALIHSPEMLFLDEPFEGVDALAARTLKDLLSRATARGMTVFLTSHVLEIVERLCTHVAIISRGGLVAQRPLEALRRGEGAPMSLEALFVSLVGGEAQPVQELDWLYGAGERWRS